MEWRDEKERERIWTALALRRENEVVQQLLTLSCPRISKYKTLGVKTETRYKEQLAACSILLLLLLLVL